MGRPWMCHLGSILPVFFLGFMDTEKSLVWREYKVQLWHLAIAAR